MEALYCLPGSGYAAIRLSGLALRRVYIEGASEDAVLKEAMMAGGMLTDSQLERIIGSLSLMDDEFFGPFFSGSRECLELMLRIILGRKDLTVVEAEAQRWLQKATGHSVRLDVWCEDDEGRVYDIEIQKRKEGAGARRARYYSAMMDASSLGKGMGYEALPESYVVFITPDDVLGHGRGLYRIERMIGGLEEPFGDGTHIVYVDAEHAGEDTEQGHLMHDFACTDPEEMHYDVLREEARRLKGAKEGRRRMNSEFEKVVREITEASRKEWELKGEKRGERRGEKRGEKRGERNAAIKAARSMLADGLVPPDKVAEYSGLSLGEVESLKDSLRI